MKRKRVKHMELALVKLLDTQESLYRLKTSGIFILRLYLYFRSLNFK